MDRSLIPQASSSSSTDMDRKLIPEPSSSTYISTTNLTDVGNLPLVKIFSYLSHPTRAKCALVCKQFYEASTDFSLFERFAPSLWAYGHWNPYTRETVKALADRVFRTPRLSWNPTRIQELHATKEKLFFTRLTVRHLQCFGHAVRYINLASSKSIQDESLRAILIVCPNITSLDLSDCTQLTMKGFEDLQTLDVLRNIKHLNLSNTKITDESVLFITQCWTDRPEDYIIESTTPRFINASLSQLNQDGSPCTNDDMIDIDREILSNRKPGLNAVFGIQILNLSGCSALTDKSLDHLKNARQALHKLHTLDLSGCFDLTGPALKAFVAVCPRMRPRNLSYCDHITNGPFSREASGCLNLQGDNCCVRPE